MVDEHQQNSGRAEEEDFQQLFEQSMRSLRPGDVVRGRVVMIGKDNVVVDIGYKSEGHIPVHEFEDRDGTLQLHEGDLIDVYFDGTDSEHGGVVLSRAKAEQFKVWHEIEEAYQSGGAVEGTIVGKVKGGLKVDVGVPAFLPGSHADLRPVRNLDRFIGQRTRFAVLKFNRARGNVVVSRRSIMEREREAMKEQTLKVLEEGVILEGSVKNITDYGAFVDLGGLDGLLHVTDMSWGRVTSRRTSQRRHLVRVVVLKYDRSAPAFARHEADHARPVDDGERSLNRLKVRGRVVSVTDWRLRRARRGIGGLVHVSEMSWTKRVAHPSNRPAGAGSRRHGARRRCRESAHPLGLKQAEPNQEMVASSSGQQPHQGKVREHHRLRHVRRRHRDDRRLGARLRPALDEEVKHPSSSTRRATMSGRWSSVSTSTMSTSRSALSSSRPIRGAPWRSVTPSERG
jgi:small subunit ribosomal protein S1